MRTEAPYDPSVEEARYRFKNVLNNILLRTTFLLEDSGSDLEDDHSQRQQNGTKAKSYRKKGYPYLANASGVTKRPTYMMRLFDRGVDLAQFSDNTPLYPICRSWISNKPPKSTDKTKGGEEEEEGIDVPPLPEESRPNEVTSLPPPLPLPRDLFGKKISIRVPAPLPRDEYQSMVINDAKIILWKVQSKWSLKFGQLNTCRYHQAPSQGAECNGCLMTFSGDSSEPFSPPVLFQNHMDRWGRVRQRWREASMYNEHRFEASFNMLTQIHAKGNRD